MGAPGSSKSFSCLAAPLVGWRRGGLVVWWPCRPGGLKARRAKGLEACRPCVYCQWCACVACTARSEWWGLWRSGVWRASRWISGDPGGLQAWKPRLLRFGLYRGFGGNMGPYELRGLPRQRMGRQCLLRSKLAAQESLPRISASQALSNTQALLSRARNSGALCERRAHAVASASTARAGRPFPSTRSFPER